ncbi:MAG: hypothetical protein HC802_10525 [Caldilineaceae bacterium]|nr:hypothetical protein [Caldilineaceae bacterium]
MRYEKAVEKKPSLPGVLLRMAAATALVALFAAGYLLLLQQPWSASGDGLALLGFAVGAFAAGLISVGVARSRIQRLRRDRLKLAQNELTTRLQESVHDGLVRAHEHLAELLRSWRQMLVEAIDELRELSTPPNLPAVPPNDIAPSHLYVSHLNQALWDRCHDYLRAQQDAFGERSEDRLDDLWGQAEWREQMLELCSRILRGVPTSTRLGPDQQVVHTLAQFIRHTVRQSIAPVSIQTQNPLRTHLIRALAQEFSIEHMLWRGAEDERDMRRQLRAMRIANPQYRRAGGSRQAADQRLQTALCGERVESRQADCQLRRLGSTGRLWYHG